MWAGGMQKGCRSPQFGDFIACTYGEQAWSDILKASGLHEPLSPVNYPFHEDIVYQLVEVSARVLNSAVPDVARALGRFCFKASQGTSFCQLLETTGHSLLDFLTNLGNLHQVIGYAWAGENLPFLTATSVMPTSLQLHYRAPRPGLSNVVVGLVEAVAREVYGGWINFQPLPRQPPIWEDQLTCLDHAESWLVTFKEQSEQVREWELEAAAKAKACYRPDASLFYSLHAHHILLDRSLNIVQLGSALAPKGQEGGGGLPGKGSAPQAGSPASRHFDIIWPPVSAAAVTSAPPLARSLSIGGFLSVTAPSSPPSSNPSPLARRAKSSAALGARIRAAENTAAAGGGVDEEPAQGVGEGARGGAGEGAKGGAAGGAKSGARALKAGRSARWACDEDEVLRLSPPPVSGAAAAAGGREAGGKVQGGGVQWVAKAALAMAKNQSPGNSGSQQQGSAMQLDLFFPWDYEKLAALEGQRVVLRVRPHADVSDPSSGFERGRRASALDLTSPLETRLAGGQHLHGSFHVTRTPDGLRGLLFVGCDATSCASLEAFEASGRKLSDCPAHDPSPCMLAKGTGDRGGRAGETDARRLRKSEAEVLMSRHAKERRKVFDSGSPSELALQILESLMQGEDVDMVQVFEVYDAMLSCGANLFRPVNVLQKLRSFDGNEEVNLNLMSLLLSKRDFADEDEEDWEDWSADSEKGSLRSAAEAQQAAAAHESTLLDGLTAKGGLVDRMTGITAGIIWKRKTQQAQHAPSQPMDKHASDAMALIRDPVDPVLQILERADDWEFDGIFELDRVTDGRPLSTLAFYLMKKTHLVDSRSKLSEARLARFLCRIEEGYTDNMYHNRIHACDVVRNIYIILTKGGILKQCFAQDDMPLAMGIIAAAVHDYEHRGVNNDFLIKTADPLALLYNDRSPMENHHLAATFTLMRENQYDFMHDMPPKVRERFRKQVIEMVLSTDMKQHFTQLSLFKTKFSTPIAPSQLAATASRSMPLVTPARGAVSMRAVSSKRMITTMSLARVASRMAGPAMDDDTKSLVMQMSLKVADLGHLASPTQVHVQWVQRLEEEFWRQGDKELAAALPVSPLMDRRKDGVTLSQKGFFSVVALPQFQAFCHAFPSCQPLLDAMRHNEVRWLTKADSHRSRTGH